ncbi:DUF4476 domain-containing protein [Spirosoma areae]
MSALSLLFYLLLGSPAWADAEFFLRIDEPGRYTVTLDDQTLSLSSGRYRFFDLPAGRLRLVILRNNSQLYQDWVELRTDSRTVTEFRARQGLRVVAVFPLPTDGRLSGSDWASPIGNHRVGTNGSAYRPGSDDNQRMAMAPQEFERIREAVKKQSFDDGKFELLSTLLIDRSLSSAQLAELLNLFAFDTKRLEAAKIGWNSVIDRPYFYTVFDVFTFSTSVKELKAYMGSR